LKTLAASAPAFGFASFASSSSSTGSCFGAISSALTDAPAASSAAHPGQYLRTLAASAPAFGFVLLRQARSKLSSNVHLYDREKTRLLLIMNH
jgi:hypothetical protein